MPKKAYSFRLSEETYGVLKNKARSSGMSLADVISLGVALVPATPMKFPVGGYPIHPVTIKGNSRLPPMTTVFAPVGDQQPMTLNSRLTNRSNAQPYTPAVQMHQAKK